MPNKAWVDARRFRSLGALGVLFMAAACGGSTKPSSHEPSAAGADAGGPSSLSEAGQAGEVGLPLGTGIAAAALEGCRGPSDAGCDVCYFATSNGACTRESGGTIEYVDYLAVDGSCPVDGPACAQCSYAQEQRLRELGDRSECQCDPDSGTIPCPPNTESCGCYCNAFNSLHRACPTTAGP